MWFFHIQLVQSKQRMTEIIKHATSEEVSELFDCERVAADSAHDPTCLICCACNNLQDVDKSSLASPEWHR